LDYTGKSLRIWQAQKSHPLIDMDKAQKILLMPEREMLYNRINHRLDTMVEQGALQEVQLLLNRGLDPQLPVMKAIGVRALSSLLRDEINKEKAWEQAKQETRRYAKRQLSWFRNQMRDENWQIFSNIKEISHIFN